MSVSMTCQCGESLVGRNNEDLVLRVHHHVNGKHADVAFSEGQLQQLIGQAQIEHPGQAKVVRPHS